MLALSNGTLQRTFLAATLSYQTPPMQMVRNSAVTKAIYVTTFISADEIPPRSRPTSAPPDGGEESTDDSVDEYRQARAIPQKRRRQKRRERAEDDGQMVRVGKAQRKRKVKVKKGPTEEDLLNLPPEEGALTLPFIILFDCRFGLTRYLDGSISVRHG
jgi:hypothetical protein